MKCVLWSCLCFLFVSRLLRTGAICCEVGGILRTNGSCAGSPVSSAFTWFHSASLSHIHTGRRTHLHVEPAQYSNKSVPPLSQDGKGCRVFKSVKNKCEKHNNVQRGWGHIFSCAIVLFVCLFSFLSLLPDDDIHDQHVSNQPHHAHHRVESSDDNRYDDRVGIVLQAAGQPVLGVASRLREARVVGEVPAEAAVVVKQGELAPVVRARAVAGALHGPRSLSAMGAARVFRLPSGACRWTLCQRCPAGCLSVVCWKECCVSGAGRTAGNVKDLRVKECGALCCGEVWRQQFTGDPHTAQQTWTGQKRRRENEFARSLPSSLASFLPMVLSLLSIPSMLWVVPFFLSLLISSHPVFSFHYLLFYNFTSPFSHLSQFFSLSFILYSSPSFTIDPFCLKFLFHSFQIIFLSFSFTLSFLFIQFLLF